jgi:Arc/MetJ family transcription regulator
MHQWNIFMSMKTTLHIDDALLEKATKLTGNKEKTSLVRLGLEALMSKEAATRLAQLGDQNGN